MMTVFLIIVSLCIIALGLTVMLEDPIIGLIIVAVGACTGNAGFKFHDLRNELHDSEQYVLGLKEGHKAELRLMAKKLEASQEAAMELSIENHALQNQQAECVTKQKVSQDTLSGIKEILEN